MRYPVDVICEIHWNRTLKGYSKVLPQLLLDTIPQASHPESLKILLPFLEACTSIWCTGSTEHALNTLASYIDNQQQPSSSTDVTITTNPFHASNSSKTTSSTTTIAPPLPTASLSWYHQLCRYFSCNIYSSSSSHRANSSFSRSLSYEEKFQILFLYVKKLNHVVSLFRTLGIGLTIRPYEIHESLAMVRIGSENDENNDDDEEDYSNSPSGTSSLRIPPSLVFIRVGKNSKFITVDDIPIFTLPLLRYWDNIHHQQQRLREIQRQKRQQQPHSSRSSRYDSDVSTSDEMGLPSPLVLPPPLDLIDESNNNTNNHNNTISNGSHSPNDKSDNHASSTKPSSVPSLASSVRQTVPQHRTPDTFSLRAPSSPLRAIHSTPNISTLNSSSTYTSGTKNSILHFLEYFTLGSPRLRSSSSGNNVSRSLRNVSSSSSTSSPPLSNDPRTTSHGSPVTPTLPVTISSDVFTPFSSASSSLVNFSLSTSTQDPLFRQISRSSSTDNLSNHSLSNHNNYHHSTHTGHKREPSPLSISSSSSTSVPRIPSLLSLESYSNEGHQSVLYPKYANSTGSPTGLVLSSTSSTMGTLRPGIFHSSAPSSTVFGTTTTNSGMNSSNSNIASNTTNPVLRIRSPLVPKVPSTNSLVGLDLNSTSSK